MKRNVISPANSVELDRNCELGTKLYRMTYSKGQEMTQVVASGDPTQRSASEPGAQEQLGDAVAAATARDVPEQEVRVVPLSLIDSGANPRTYFDPGEFAELVASVRALGVAQPVLLRPVGDRFEIVAGERRERVASPSFGGHHLAVTVPSEVGIRLEAESLRIAPGQQLRFTATIDRRGGLLARIPVEALNLPFGLRVLDVGLNGVLINEGETSRSFEVVCDPWAEPGRWPFFAVARIESKNERSASNVIELEVVSGGAPTAPTPGAP
jgi:hypothetical protein